MTRGGRRVGRPFREGELDGPWRARTGSPLREVMTRWDEAGVPLPRMARTLLQVTGMPVSIATLRRMLARWREEGAGAAMDQMDGMDPMDGMDGAGRTPCGPPAGVPENMYVQDGLGGFH